MISLIDQKIVQILQWGNRKIWLFTLWQWLVGVVLPVILFIALFASHHSYGFVEDSGVVAFFMLFGILVLPPLAKIFSEVKTFTKLLPLRKEVGIAMFYVTLFHGLSYYWSFGSVDAALVDIQHTLTVIHDPWHVAMRAGMMALVVCFILFLTSNTYSLRLLKRSWKKLHLMVWIVLLLTIGHVIALAVAGRDPDVVAYIVAVLIVVGLRGYAWWQRKSV